MDERIKGATDGRTDGWTDGQTDNEKGRGGCCCCSCCSSFSCEIIAGKPCQYPARKRDHSGVRVVRVDKDDRQMGAGALRWMGVVLPRGNQLRLSKTCRERGAG